MQFVSMSVALTTVIKIIPDKWWLDSITKINSLLAGLRASSPASSESKATQISTLIGRRLKISYLVNCTVSDSKLVTINIPIGETFYQIRIEPSRSEGPFDLRIFYPAESGAALWFGRIAAKLVYDHDMRTDRVTVDGEEVSVGAWNAMCSLMVAQGCEEGGEVCILMDMAREGVI